MLSTFIETNYGNTKPYEDLLKKLNPSPLKVNDGYDPTNFVQSEGLKYLYDNMHHDLMKLCTTMNSDVSFKEYLVDAANKAIGDRRGRGEGVEKTLEILRRGVFKVSRADLDDSNTGNEFAFFNFEYIPDHSKFSSYADGIIEAMFQSEGLIRKYFDIRYKAFEEVLYDIEFNPDEFGYLEIQIANKGYSRTSNRVSTKDFIKNIFKRKKK